MSLAPASRAVMSMPVIAPGSRPTGVSAENRPPTSLGRSNIRTPSDCPIVRSVPERGSVVNTRCSFARTGPSAASKRCRTIR